jgi:hypothetical protein
LISKNHEGTKVEARMHSNKMMSMCDISPDGKLVGIISSNMNFIGQNRLTSPQLFLKNVEDGKVYLISAESDGKEMQGKVLNCYFTQQGQSIIFIHEPDYSNRRMMKKVLVP